MRETSVILPVAVMARPRKYPLSFICIGCGTLTHVRPAPARDCRRMYCSARCKLWAWNHPDGNLRPELLPKAPKPKTVKPFSNCLICGQACPNRLRKTCSDACANVRKRTARLAVILCFCGVSIPAGESGRRPAFCSDACRRTSPTRKAARRIARAMRKARMRGNAYEQIDPYMVFARDGWRCQQCGARTTGTLRGTNHKRAPELDHIVPLSRGGTHTWSNVQCLCRACNLAKGAAWNGCLRLIGWSSSSPLGGGGNADHCIR